MSDAFFDKFIADLVKGAEVNSRANGGPGVNILIDREHRGHEEKLAALGKTRTLDNMYADGVKAAAATFHIKEALLGELASMAGNIGGGMLARKALPKLTGLAGHAAEMGGQMLGGHIGAQLAPQQPPPMA